MEVLSNTALLTNNGVIIFADHRKHRNKSLNPGKDLHKKLSLTSSVLCGPCGVLDLYSFVRMALLDLHLLMSNTISFYLNSHK